VVETSFTNSSGVTLEELYWFAFANRFATADQGINDFNRPFIYPYQDFVPGQLTITHASADGVAVSVRQISAAGVPDGCIVAVRLSAPLPPNGRVSLRLEFETTLPTRFGTFGIFENMLTAVGGWHPYPANLHEDGTWGLDEPPPLASYIVTATRADPMQVLVNGVELGNGAAQRVDGVHFLSLIAAPELVRDEIEAGATRIIHLRRPRQRYDRRAFGPSHDEILRESLRSIVANPPAGVTMLPEQIVIVEAPLRLDLTAPGEGMVVISDRSLKVNGLLRPFQEAQLAQAIYAEALRPLVTQRESIRDYVWVGEGVPHFLAERYMSSSRPPARSVRSWIELFNIFAIVDRFESEPKIPFVSAFFDRQPSADPLHHQITTFNRERPPGRVVLGKLAQILSRDDFEAVLGRCSEATVPFVECAEGVAPQPLQDAVTQWLQPYPDINYEIASTALRQPQGDLYLNEVTVRRRGEHPRREPVDVELRGIGGHPLRLGWDGIGDEGHLQATSHERLYQVVIDPDRKLIETTRADNAAPAVPQVVVDSAEVEVSSTEFGLSGLMVGRGRYDYRKDIAAAGLYTNRGIGVTVGPRYHWGERNDSTLYRHNLYGFYTAQALDRSFKDDRAPDVVTSGHSNGIGLRYNYNNLFSFDNPTESVDLRLFGDWYDESLGSDYNYAAWGGSAVVTQPLWSYRTIVAAEVTNGFTQPIGGSRVPNQGLFSLGGSRSIRGIGVEEELGRNLFLLRTEVRQTIYPELDLNFLDLLVMRRSQLRFFVDTGSVSNSAGSIYNPEHYAVGIGAGFAIVYDFMGFFPSIGYAEIATRVDRGADDVQFLFGTRQAF